MGAAMVKDEDIYKSDANARIEENATLLRKELDERKEKLKAVVAKLDDPVFQGALMYTVAQEKENQNRILKNIYAEVERLRGLEGRIGRLEERLGKATTPENPSEIPLPEVDAQIIEFIRASKKACAEDVQKKFRYRGKNAASARLSRMYSIGVLNKAQSGRKVWYFLR